MITAKNQEKLVKERAILLTTLDYLLENYTGYLVLDNYDVSRDYYLQEQRQAENYFVEGKLERIRARISQLAKGFQLRRDINYKTYVETKTGYQINPYRHLRKGIDQLLQTGKVADREAFLDLQFMIQLVEQDQSELDFLAKMKGLYDKHVTYFNGSVIMTDTQCIDDQTTAFDGAKTPDLATQQKRFPTRVISPNLKNWMDLQTSGKNALASSYIVIGIDEASGPLFCVKGADVPIKAQWTNDSAITIEIKRDWEIVYQYEKVTTRKSNIEVTYITN